MFKVVAETKLCYVGIEVIFATNHCCLNSWKPRLGTKRGVSMFLRNRNNGINQEDYQH